MQNSVRFVRNVGVAPATSTVQYYMPYGTPQSLRGGLGLINETDAWLTGRPYGLPGTTAIRIEDDGRSTLIGADVDSRTYPNIDFMLGPDFTCNGISCQPTTGHVRDVFRELQKQINRVVPDAQLALDGMLGNAALASAMRAARVAIGLPGFGDSPDLQTLASGQLSLDQLAARSGTLIHFLRAAAGQGMTARNSYGLGDGADSGVAEVLRQIADVERASQKSLKRIAFWTAAMGSLTVSAVLVGVAVQVARRVEIKRRRPAGRMTAKED